MFKYTTKSSYLLHIYSKVPICTALYNDQLASKAPEVLCTFIYTRCSVQKTVFQFQQII